MNFKVCLKDFGGREHEVVFIALGEAIMYYFRNLGSDTQRIELYENTSTGDTEPFWRIIVSAHRNARTAHFVLIRNFNIF